MEEAENYQTESDLQKVTAINDCLQDMYDNGDTSFRNYDRITTLLKPKLKQNVALNIKLNNFLDKHIHDYNSRREAKDELFELVADEIVGTFRVLNLNVHYV